MTNTKQQDWEKKFDEKFWEIMGTETDPEGTPNMYLIRDEYGHIRNGIDFNEEKEHLKDFIQNLLTQQKKEIVEMITKYDLIPVQVREENPYYWDGHKKTIEIITNLLTKEDD